MKNTASPRTPRKTTKTPPAAASVSPADIAARAYEFYCARGFAPGGELDDWLRAERELTSMFVPQKARRARSAAQQA